MSNESDLPGSPVPPPPPSFPQPVPAGAGAPPPPPGLPPSSPPTYPPSAPGYASGPPVAPPEWAPASQRAGMAVAALVLGIVGVVLCFIFIPSLLALIFGLVAAKRIKRSNGAVTGKGLARAGWILGLVGLLVGAGFWTAAAAGVFDDGEVALDDLEVGMCANLADLEGEVSTVPTVECTEPHDAELTAIGQLNEAGDEEYPGESQTRQMVGEQCSGESFTDFVGVPYEESEFEINFIFPNQDAWNDGDGEYVCFLFTPGRAELTSSVRGSRR